MKAAHNRQRGVAIITAMLVIALGTIAMVGITASQQLSLQRERNEALIQQARALGVSGERFAAAVLFRDRRDALRNNTDSLEDDWAQTLPPVPIDNASLQGCIVDMQGRFNLNNMVDAAGNALPDYVNIFKRLLTEVNIEPSRADAVLDWIDSDPNPTGAEGAEDDYYTGLEVGYRAANAPFVSVSELQLVKGFSSAVEEESENYELLLPHISVLPVDGSPVPVNVNTATPQVLAALSPLIQDAATLSTWETSAYEDYPECEDIFDLTPSAPSATSASTSRVPFHESKLLFEQAADTAGTGEKIEPEESFDVFSRFFQVRIDVEAEGIIMTQYTLLERDASGRSRVIYRSRDSL